MSEYPAARCVRLMRDSKDAVDRIISGTSKQDRKRLRELKVYERKPDQGDRIILYMERERARRARYLREHLSSRGAEP